MPIYHDLPTSFASETATQAALSTAESLAREEASKFRDSGDKRGEAGRG